jgi:predicted membrane GTPase involved in stress response
VAHVPSPNADINGDLKMLVSQTESNKYFGKMLIGRLHSGKLSVGDRLQSVD